VEKSDGTVAKNVKYGGEHEFKSEAQMRPQAQTAAAVQSEINVAFPCLGETGPDTCKEKLRYTHFKGHIKLQHTATYNTRQDTILCV
jgi:hypothetical protein